jgi:ABC-type lipoprotein release transport system permease subunit
VKLRTMGTLAWRDLGRNRRRTLLTLTAVALGLALMIFMDGMITGIVADTLRNAIRLQTGHVQVRAEDYEDGRLSLRWPELVTNPGAVAERARALPHVVAASPVLWAAGLLTTRDEATSLQVVGLDPASPVFAPLAGAVTAGEFAADEDRDGLLIGQRLAANLGLDVGQRVGLDIVDGEGRLRNGTFTVRGLFATGIPSYDEGSVFLPLSRAQAFAGVGERASAVVMTLDSQDEAPAVAAALAEPGRKVLTWRELNEFLLVGYVSLAQTFYWILYGVVILIVAVVLANSLLMTVFERIRELGILAALGMRRRQIVAMVLVEAAVLGLMGIAVGLLLGLAVVLYVGQVGIGIGDASSTVQGFALGTRMYTHVSPVGMASLSAWTLAVIVLVSLYPAVFAARLEPADALHRS